MKKVILVGLVVCMLVGWCLSAQAADAPPTLQLRTVTLLPLAKDKDTQAGFMLDLHFIPQATLRATDSEFLSVLKKAQNLLANNTSAAWYQTSANIQDLTNIREGSPGFNVMLRAREATINGGLVWRTQDHCWYGHIDFKF